MRKKLFFTFNDYLQETFGCRVYKVSVDGGFNCPNRDGVKSHFGCIFCDTKGSSSQTNALQTSISDQVIENIHVRKTRYKAKKFIVYFQSFTNTYAPVEILKKRYDEGVFAHQDIIGLSIGTRSDCVDNDKLSLISSYKDHLPYVSLEFGMQTIHNTTLLKINRQENHDDFLRSIELARKHGLEPVVHVILGLPGETDEDMLKTADTLKKLQIKGVKIHVLSALENTPLADVYAKGNWSPLTYERYLPLVCDFIERLPNDCIIYRFAGGGHPKEILAPKWPYEKKHSLQKSISEELIRRNTYQGYFSSNLQSSCL